MSNTNKCNCGDQARPHKGRGRRGEISDLQLEALVNFMEEPSRKEFARGSFGKGLFRINLNKRWWAELADILNNLEGVNKNPMEWSRYYTQMKATLKRRIRSINDSYTGTGGGAPKGGELTVIEQRLQAVLGSGFATKLPNVAIDPGFNSDDTDDDKEDEPREYVEEYNTKLQPEVALAPRAPSPRSVLYNLAEILARNSPNDRPENKRNDKTPTAETTSSVSNETNNILREIVQELKRSNELKTEQNGYLIELLTQLKTPTCIDARQDTDITHIADSQTDIHATDIQKQEVNAQDEMSHFNEMNEDRCIEVDTMPAKRTPVIRPVALSSLTTVNTPGPQLKRVKVHSILKSEPKNTARRLVRLKDGTMVLVPNGMKPQVRPNEDNNADQLYVVCKRR